MVSMSLNPEREPSLSFFGAPLASARVVVILIHGRSQSPADMEAQVVRRVELPNVAYVAPAAANRSWYPAGFMVPTGQNEPYLGFAVDRIWALSDALAGDGVPVSNQVVMGFSQGACLACEYVYRRRRRFGALVAFTGGLVGPPGTEWSASEQVYRDMPVLLGGSNSDDWVPAERMLETAEVFRRLRARVAIKLYPSMGHVIGDEQITDARAILSELMARSMTARGA